MRLASWSIRSVTHRQGRLLDWLRARKPDLVALQKINVQAENLPFDAFACAGYHVEVHYPPPKCRGDCGIAILSRRKPHVLQKGLPGQGELGPRLLTVEVNGLEFSSVYAPAANEDLCPAEVRIEWFESLTRHLKETRPESGRRVLCGDFNVRLECRGETNSHKGVLAQFRAMLNEEGLSDLYCAPPAGWSDRFAYEGREGCIRFSRLEHVLGTQRIVDLNPVVSFDISHAIVRNPPYCRVRAPIIADLDDQAASLVDLEFMPIAPPARSTTVHELSVLRRCATIK